MKKIKELYGKICVLLLPLKKLFHVCFRIARLLTIIVLGTILVTTFLMERSSIEVQAKIHNDYERTIIGNVYTDNPSDTENIEKVKNVLDNLPKPILDEIEKNWIILISKDSSLETLENPDGTMGITYYKYNVIWMQSDFTEKQFLHECGHVYDFLCGEIHRTKEFQKLYFDNWQYIENGNDKPDAHCVSSASEFWAEMFAEYLTSPEHMKENFKDGYDYFKKITSETWRFTFLGQYHGSVNRLFLIVGEKFSNLIQTPTAKAKITTNKITNIFHKKIDVEQYDYQFDYNFKCETSQTIYNTVIDIIQNPDNYQDNIVMYFDADTTYESYVNAQQVLQLYFATTKKIIKTGFEYSSETGLKTTISLDKQTILDLETSRLNSLKNIENAISNFKDGNTTSKLLQVSDYIMNYATNQSEEQNITSDTFWNERQSNSLINAMVFKQFCNSLGIKCEVLFTPLPTNVEHYFNVVILDNENISYYDVSNRNSNLINVEQYDKIVYGHY